jgi:hypothetical protein
MMLTPNFGASYEIEIPLAGIGCILEWKSLAGLWTTWTRWCAATSMRIDGSEKLDRTTMLIIAIGLGGLMLAAFITL